MGFKAVLLTSYLNLLLPLGLLAVVLHRAGVGERHIFLLALLGIVPLAERLGFVTEQMALYTNPTTGALLNATFGNITEVLVAYIALKQNMLRVVQLSLLGSILSNMLLVLGGAFFCGGLRHPTQKYSKDGVIASSGLLMLGTLSLMMPALLVATHPELEDPGPATLGLSRVSAILLLFIYMALLYFQLVSHRSLYEEAEEDDEPRVVGFWAAIAWLALLTALVSLLSDYLVDAIEGAARGWGVNIVFIATILLPIVGNAAEHAAAIMFAMKNKMDLAIGVAIGSSTQITLMAVPLSVLAGWAMGRDMDLNFHAFETGALFTTVITVMFVTHDGSSNWLRGLTLVLAYAILSASFFYHRDKAFEALTSKASTAT